MKMGLDNADCAYSPGAGVCKRDLPSSDCLRFHFAPADARNSESFPYWVKDSGEVPISVGTRVFQGLLYFLLAVLFAYSCVLTLILRRSRTGTVWFYTSTSNKRAA